MDLLPKVFRTEGNITKFDPSKIFESILKETRMTEKDAKYITELVVRRIISSGIKFLSGPHIREIVCSILSEQHFENERKLYTRIGMPLMDFEDILIKGLFDEPHKQINPEIIQHWAANQIAEEYAHLRILDNEESKAHLAGDIHINGLNYFVLRPYTQMWDSRLILKHGLPPMNNFIGFFKRKPAHNLKSALSQLSKWLTMMQSEFYGNQGFHFITNFLAPYVQNMTEDKLCQIFHNFLYEINQVPLTIGREISELSLLSSPIIIPEFLEYQDYQQECKNLFKAMITAFREIYQNGNFVSIPKHYILFGNKLLNSIEEIYPKFWDDIELVTSFYFVNSLSVLYKNNVLKQILKKDYHNFGTLQTITLNLPRYAYISKNEDAFIEFLRSKLNLCTDILVKKFELIKERINSKHLPFCSSTIVGKPLFDLDNQRLSYSLVGLNEAIKFLTNYELHEHSDAINLGVKILSEINELCSEVSEKKNKKFVLCENVSERAIKRFTKLDLRDFPKEVESVLKNQIYTNSTHYRDDAEIDILTKVKTQEEFHKLIHENAIIYISLQELKRNGFTIKNFIKKILKDTTISCLKFYS